MSGHALLSASSAHRWLHCTPCARLEAGFPDTAGDYAREGTLAHEIAELKLRKKFLEPMSQKTFTTRMNKLKKHELYQQEMQGFTDIYIDYLAECAMRYPTSPSIAAEVRVDYAEWAPEGFGRCDCIMAGGDTLHIVDFKYGKGKPVSAAGNEQLRLYALGALRAYGLVYRISRVRMAIVQPRLDSITEDEMPAEALLDWAENVVRPAAALAYAGEGEFQAGDWCQFCRARRECRARANTSLSIIEDFGAPPDKTAPIAATLLSYQEIGAALARAKPFIKWAADLESYALEAALHGKEIPGWKVVAGRSNRVFRDQDAAFAALQQAGFDEALLYERKPITLTQAEKLAGKAAFTELCGAYIEKPPGKPTLVPETDARPPYSSAAEDFAVLTNT